MGLMDRAAATWEALCEIAPQSPRGRDLLIEIHDDTNRE
jgi:hypothetical protein